MQFQAILRGSEAATRATLVDPLLRALGWNISDLNRVEIEKVKNNTRVDYLLKKPDEQVFAVVEAKSLTNQLRNPDLTRQIGDYQRTFYTKDVWLTDGIQWLFYDSYDPGREPYRVNLMSDNLSEAALYFLYHLDVMLAWPPRFDYGTDPALLERLTRTESRLDLLEQAANAKQQVAPAVLLPTTQVYTPYPTPVSATNNAAWREMKNCGDVTGKAITGVRLPDGTEHSIKYWNDVLLAIAKYFLAKKPDAPIPFYDSDRRTMVLIGDDNSVFKATKPLNSQSGGRTLYLNTNYSALSIIAKCLYLVSFLSPEYQQVEPAILLAER
jgi:hypothetical protein